MSDKTKVHFNKTPEEIIRDRRQKELDQNQSEAQAQMARMKGVRQPLGGAPPVRIPPLNAEPIEGGGPMAQQAEILTDPTSPLSPAYDPNLAMMMHKAHAQSPKTDGPFSVLPPEAQHQPGFVKGIGSMYAANQPALKKQQHEAVDGYKPVLSEKTRASMEALAAFQTQAQHMQEEKADDALTTPEDKKRQDDVANLGKQVEKTNEDLYKDLQEMLDDPRQWNLLNNPQRRKEIEGRLVKMDITDIIVYGEIRQDVTIVPDKLTVTYRSVSGEEDLAVKQLMFGEHGGDKYLLDKYTIMQLSMALVAINGDELPTHLDEKKKWKEELFLRKYEKVIKFPIQFIADLGVQYLWFDERVRRLFLGSTEELKNT